MPLSSPQVRNGILIEFADFLKGRPVEFERLRGAVGLEPLAVDNPKQAVPLNAVVGLFDRAALHLDEPCLGVQFAGAMRLGASGLMGHLILNSPTIRAGMLNAKKYFEVFVTGLDMAASEDSEGLQWSWSYPEEISAPRMQFNLFLLATMVFRVRRAAGVAWRPASVRLEGDQPPWCEQLATVFGSKISYQANRNSIQLDPACLDLPIPKADPQLYVLFQELAEKWLREGVTQPGIVTAVRNELMGRLRTGEADLEHVAKRLSIAPRSLQWRLEQVGTTYENVRNDTRRSLAEYYLCETDRPLVEIAHELGFSEQSAFTRAAQRWFDKSPRSYRRLHRPKRALSQDDAA